MPGATSRRCADVFVLTSGSARGIVCCPKKGEHINIGKLERFVSDFDTAMNLTRADIVQKSRGRVAVIGSGPAGLTIAGELARKGVAVEIFEMEGRPEGY